MASGDCSVKEESKYSDLMLPRMLQEIRHKAEAEAMTDGELAHALIEEVWAHAVLWTRAGVLIDEAITRLKRQDTRRRWAERKAKRAARQTEARAFG
jgi:hypothetical protein